MIEHPSRRFHRFPFEGSIESGNPLRRSDTLTKRSITTGHGKRSKQSMLVNEESKENKIVPLPP